MHREIKVVIIGDYNPTSRHHIATDEALGHAAAALSVSVTTNWIPTEALAAGPVEEMLKPFDAIWCGPGSPYKSMDGALEAIRFARERERPFIGTWGGAQHALVEYARNVLGIEDAEHEESAPGAPTLLISKLTCSLAGKIETVKIEPGSLAHRAYGRVETTEQFACNYGVNPLFRDTVEQGRLKVTGVDVNGEVRMVEVADHPFYVATLFLPQALSTPGKPHPLVVAYLRAGLGIQKQITD